MGCVHHVEADEMIWEAVAEFNEAFKKIPLLL
jgi:hypothetical protein